MAQVQCPNCGGFKVDTSKYEDVYGATVRVPVPANKKKRETIIWVIVGLGIVILYFLFGVFGILISGNLLAPLLVFLTPQGIGTILWAAFWYWVLLADKKTRPIIATVYHYTCWLCGYKWDWKSGESLPPVNLRTDLIAKGEQRLEEERLAAERDARANAVAQDVLRRQGVIK